MALQQLTIRAVQKFLQGHLGLAQKYHIDGFYAQIVLSLLHVGAARDDQQAG